MRLVPPMEVTDALLVSSSVAEDDAEVYSASKIYATGDTVMVTAGEHRVYEALQGTAVVVSMTIASPCVITWTGSAPAADTPFQLSTTGALPTGLTAGTTYYVKSPSGSTSNVAATAGGANINTSGSQSGVHTARHGANVGKTPSLNSDPDASPYWLDTGATNRWRLFDEVVGQQCTDADEIEVVLAPDQICNTLALFNLDAAEVRVQVHSAEAVSLYDETFSLVADRGVLGFYSWLFTPQDRLASLVVNDLPAYPGVEVTVTLSGDGAIGAGELVLGMSRHVGDTMWDTEVGITDYSFKEQDDFGNWRITPRAFSRSVNAPIWLEGSRGDAVMRLFERYRSTPVVWIGIDDTASTHVYGFYEDFRMALKSFPMSLYLLKLQGLT